MTPQEILARKRNEVMLHVGDVFSEEDDPTWREKHPLGPVHVQVKCKCCGEVVARDLRDFGWFKKPSFVESNLLPHYKKHLTD